MRLAAICAGVFVASLLVTGCGRRRSSAVSASGEAGTDAGVEAVHATEELLFRDCEEDNKQIYVVTDRSKFLRFLPVKRTFHSLGTLRCPTSAQPFSMAVDRRGMAYVLYNDGSLFRVWTRNLRCEDTDFEPSSQRMRLFGMAFVSDAVDSPTETLWIASNDSPYKLARLNVKQFRVESPMPFVGRGGRFELTGRGDGRVFGFDPEPPARLVEIDPRTGTILKDEGVTGMTECRNWAVAQYWGDFWIFCDNHLTRYSLKDGKSELVLSGLEHRVVGAGVSTCAPSSPEGTRK